MNRKNAVRKQKKSRKWAIILWLIIFTFVAAFTMYLFTLFGAEGIGEILGERDYWLMNGVIDGLILIGYLFMYRVDAQNIAIKENDLEDTKWLTVKKLKKLKEFTVTDWTKVGNKEDGIVIGAEDNSTRKTKNAELILTNQLHALIVGTTGSGKTTGFVDQNIAVLARSKSKPILIVTDPKKELYEKHAVHLREEGYKVSMLDLREPYSSVRWNPMNVLIRRIRLVKDLEYNLKFESGKYYGAGETFVSFDAARTRKQELMDEIYENAKDLVYTLCPVQNKDQPTWEEGARNLILGLVLVFCEDCIKDVMEEKQLLLFNVYHNITKYCSEDTTALKEYLLNGRAEFSKVRGLVNTVLITSDKTLTSYLSEVNAYMQQLSDDGIMSLTSENELDISELDESPNAVFVVVPDERFTRHRFVTLFITQMYKELVEKANLNLRRGQTESAVLKRNAYFVLDEYGNLPRFENMDGMVTVARSRGIRFMFVLQSFSQLAAKYGKEIAEVVKSNCNVKLFIGSDDPETRKEFSELCGQKKVKNFSVNTNAESSASSNTGASNQPLITVGMLERLNGNEKGDAIVSVRGYEPIWTRFTPSYELKSLYFKAGKADTGKRGAVLFDKEEYAFDIDKRTKEIKAKELDAIEREDNREEAYQSAERERLAILDKKWYAALEEIQKEGRKVVEQLNEEDRTAFETAKLENKAMFLYAVMDKYKEKARQDFIRYAEYLTKEGLPKLLEIQTEATK